MPLWRRPPSSAPRSFPSPDAQPIPNINLVIDPQGFAFSSADSIRSYHFVPGSVRYWDFAGLAKCLRQSIEFQGESDLSQFKRLEIAMD